MSYTHISSSTVKNEKSAHDAHDIKALANGVSCLSALLENTPLSIEQAEIVYLLKKSAEELNAIMSQMLEESKQANVRKTHKKESFNLKETLNALFKTFCLTIQSKPVHAHLTIQGNVPSTIKGDKMALHRIVSNLLHNAGKFTHSGNIDITVSSTIKSGSNVLLKFQVKDTGIGIPQEHQKHIFEHFTSFNSDGYGLGLANVKELIEQNEGSITVESEVGQGTIFTFSLPYEIAQFKASQKVAPLSMHSLKDVKILIVDDDAVYRQYLTLILTQSKAQLTVVKTSKEALEIINSETFDMILMDLKLAEINGYDTAFEIRNTVNINRKTPILAMSASQADKTQLKLSGITDIMPKPLNTEGLVNRIYKALVSVKKTPKNVKLTFSFNEHLNVSHLNTLYGNDIEHAQMMFETFLKESLPFWYETSSHFNTIKEAVHRFKPAASMVGLTDVEQVCTHLEAHFSNYSDVKIQAILTDINKQLAYFKPILEKELKRLRYLNRSLAA